MLAGALMVSGLLSLLVRHDPALDRPAAGAAAIAVGASVPVAEVPT
jgi:hypothetical protein